MRKTLVFAFVLLAFQTFGQQQGSAHSGSDQFWEQLKTHCGKSYEGALTSATPNDTFTGKKLVMHVRSCDEENVIRIPFFVGDDRSRTWVLTKRDNGTIELKHDHRHEDGSPDKVTMYGGTSPNTGSAKLQYFPADQETTDLIDYAATNVWWITLDENSFSYNLRRVVNDNHFSVKFDLTEEVDTPAAPWGAE
ncbi:hypothetical protein [Anditalea andensis]|uniref:Secreted protein n=1 Tax=Anditalea andensis TaxID=1048983 RepID=A0A074KXI7_9BACT|nr:hypothetical protein [Anditalea andensis]KEO73644.1 hypothetical protein EL17_12145 [Anditalea andensis]